LFSITPRLSAARFRIFSRPSAPTQPEALHAALAGAFNAQDLESLLSLYDENATLMPTITASR
jgi:hypothetical protein